MIGYLKYLYAWYRAFGLTYRSLDIYWSDGVCVTTMYVLTPLKWYRAEKERAFWIETARQAKAKAHEKAMTSINYQRINK